MSKKEVVLSVILGVALVSVVSTAIALIIDAFSLIVDYDAVYIFNSKYKYQYAIGVLELVAVAITIGLAVAICIVKGKRSLLSVILACVMTMFCIVSIIILRLNVDGEYNSSYGYYKLNKTDYTLFLAYVTSVISLAVSVLVSVVSYMMLSHNKKQQQAVEQNSDDVGTTV